LKFIKSKFVLTVVIWMGVASGAYAIDLYVNTKTKQIFTEAGPDRERIGAFERVEDKPAQTAAPAVLPPRNRSAELKAKAETARLISKVDSLESEVKKSNAIKVTVDKKGLQVKTADDNFKFKLGGRIHTSYTASSNDNFLKGGVPAEANDGTEIRRARLYFAGTFYKDWFTKLQVDFGDNNVRIKDMYLDYTGLGDFGLSDFGLGKVAARIGNQKQAFSRELQDSSNDLMFQERSLMNVLNEPVVDRAIGFNIRTSGKNYSGQVGIYGEPLTPNKTSMDEGWGVSSRVTFNPIANNDNGVQKLVHLGIAGNYRKPSDAGHVSGVVPGVRYRHETAHDTDLFPVDTGVIGMVNNIRMIGIEANGVYGPFSVGGEYTHSWMDRKMGMSSLGFHGWYGEASWSLTGESRTYKAGQGKFKRLKPNRNFNFTNVGDGAWGAWELAARVAGVDMNDGAFQGGEMKNFTVALNWYANENVRFMFGFDRILQIKNSPLVTASGGKPDGLNTFMFRNQIAF
jgi:phosphate-selective porin OprO/OprP